MFNEELSHTHIHNRQQTGSQSHLLYASSTQLNMAYRWSENDDAENDDEQAEKSRMS